MNRGIKFWLIVAAMQVVFGLLVFMVTRQIYMQVPNDDNNVASTGHEGAQEWSDRILDINPTLLDPLPSSSPPANLPNAQDPAVLSQQAGESFNNKQYSRAAELYEQLLLYDPKNVDVHNNLGITLHYLGRSDEALSWLDKGVALDSNHQRIWLTLGFVNSQLGNIEQARAALTTAAEMDRDTTVGQSAARMLEELP
jgi:tetratricopeptide (TPR) repeat protein